MPEPEHQRNWDPLPNERQYVRSMSDGNLGYKVRRDGVDKVRLDRPMQEMILPYNNGDGWVDEREYKPFSMHQVTVLAFEADKLLCKMLGMHKEAKAEWLSLPEEARIDWMQNGPKNAASLRTELYLAVMGVVRKHAR